MCGRFIRTSPAEILRAEFGVTTITSTDLPPRYNVCPGREVAAIVSEPTGRRLGMLRWGLVPSFTKDPRSTPTPINARAETVHTRPAFRTPLRRRRCLVVADGFYEWKKEGKVKTPWLIRLRSGRPFAFAGLWDRWRPPEGEALHSCAIITCAPNELMAGIHDRMPVILSREAIDRWLDPSIEDPEALRPLLVPCPADDLEAFPVSRLVNSPRNDSPACLEPLRS